MKERKKLQSILCIVMMIMLLAGLCGSLFSASHSQPDDPIGARDDRLHAETAAGGGSLWSSEGGNAGDEDPSSTGETPEPDEPQSPDEPQDPDEPQNPDEPQKPDEPQNPDKPQEPDKPEEGKGDSGGGTDPGKTEGGGSSTDTPGGGPAGGDGDGGSTGGDSGGAGDKDDTPRIYTDLRNNMYFTRSDLPDGRLTFEAYPLGKGEDLTVKVVLQNSNTSGNGKVLISSDGKHYTAELVYNEPSYVTIYLREKGDNIAYVRYRLNYYADKANETNPEVGDNPPTIVTSLDGAETDFTSRELLFWVRATTHPELGGKTIYSNQIQVWLDDELLTKQSGDARPEYDIVFPLPNIEGTVPHVIKVLAWDGKGNSTYKYYNVTFSYIPEGVLSGEVTVVLDATAAGRGVMDSGKVVVASGDTVASAVRDFLTLYGYAPTYDGTETNAFYLRSISRPNIGKYAFIPSKLQELLERDGATFTGRPKRDSLGEFDFTRGSGWMYAIDGEVYPNRSMSLYPVQPGMTIYIRYTLAYGKDIGGFFEEGAAYGALSSYCRLWINGNIDGQELPHNYQESARVEPTETTDGYVEYTCTKCHENMRETLPATGGDPGPTEPADPAGSAAQEQAEVAYIRKSEKLRG